MPHSLKVLIVEDNPADAELVLRQLKRAGFAPEWSRVDSETAYLASLHGDLDIILSDYEMPQFSGLRALELLRESGLDVPLILISGTIGEDTAVAAMKEGAFDYLLKDRLTRLGPAINHALEQSKLRQERQRTARELRESEERFREVVQNIEEVFWMTNVEKNEMLFVSAAYEKIWGRTCTSLYASPMTWLEAIHPDDRERVLHSANTKQLDGTYHEEYRIIRPDGTIRWINDRAFPIRNAEGAVRRIAGVARDVTARKQAETALRLFRALVDQSAATFEVIDPATGRFLDVNDRGPAEIGCTREEYLSLRVFDIDPIVTESTWPKMAEKIRTNSYFSGEGSHRRKDGTSFPIEFNAKWVRVDRDYIVTVVRDITERKRAEEVLQESSLQKVGRQEVGMRKDLAGIGAVCALLFGIFYFLDPIQAPVQEFAAKHFENLDDLVEGIAVIVFGVAVFFYRRWREFQEQARQEAQVREALRVLRDELELRVQQRTVDLSRSNEALRTQIVERERAGEELRESERRFREMLENVELIAMTLDKKGAVTFCNDYLLKVTDWSREEVIGQEWFSRFIPGQAGAIQLFLDTIEAGNIPAHYENPIQTKDGSLREIVWNNTVLRDGAGNILGTASIGEDVTERKRSEERVREQAAMLDLAHDAIIVRGFDDHTISFWSHGAEILYGWTVSEAIGRDIGDLICVDPAGPDEIRDALLTTDEWRGETQHRTKSGQQLTVNTRATLVRDATGAPRSVLSINTDITGQKELEGRFLRAQRMESIGTLAGGIAHDLNNCLGPIIMSFDMLKMKFTDPASQELLDILGTSAQRGADMVRQVLSFGRGVEGRRIELQIKHIVREIEKIVGDTFLKNIVVRTNLPHDLWTIVGDPTQLHQVLLNLCVNARDAMPNGGNLTISGENITLDAQYAGLEPDARPGPYVLLHVEDTGTGMPSEVIDKIFEPFFTTKEIGKGTGLGLSTSLGIVKSHGGFLRVESEVGQGTVFHIHLPARTGALPDAAAELADELPPGNGELILVVDDEASVRQITRQTLEAFGYRVVLAGDGAEACSVFATRGQEIAALLVDMMMPVMDGPTAVQVLRRMNPRLPIMAVSGLATNAQEAQVASLGVKHFLAKPFTAETLLKTLRQLLTETAAGA